MNVKIVISSVETCQKPLASNIKTVTIKLATETKTTQRRNGRKNLSTILQ